MSTIPTVPIEADETLLSGALVYFRLVADNVVVSSVSSSTISSMTMLVFVAFHDQLPQEHTVPAK